MGFMALLSFYHLFVSQYWLSSFQIALLSTWYLETHRAEWGMNETILEKLKRLYFND